MTSSARTSIPATLTSDRDSLVRRLEDGDRKIAEARQSGSDVSRLEQHWIRLLREYEATCDAMRMNRTTDLRTAA